MKLIVLQENLVKAVNLASKFSSNRAQLPVLSNILLSTDKNKINLAATNLEMAISISVGAKITQEGRITIPAKVLNDLVANLKKGAVEVSTDKERVSLKAENFNSTIVGMNASDFPVVPQNIGLKAISLPQEDLVGALNKVIFAVSIDETRPVLTGILVFIDGTKMTIVATDGFRLAKKSFSVPDSKKVLPKLIIPKNALYELSSLVGEDETILVKHDLTNNQVLFGIDSTVLSTRMIQGEFPVYEKIIPEKTKVEVNVDKQDLLQAVKLAAVFARDSANVVRFNINSKGIELTAESQYAGNQKTFVDAKVNGMTGSSKLVIAYNFKFVQEFLQVVEGEDVVMKFNDANSPGVFLDPKDTDYLHLIMPVRLTD